MTLGDRLKNVRVVRVPRSGHPVERTVARELLGLAARRARVIDTHPRGFRPEAGTINVAVAGRGFGRDFERLGVHPPRVGEWVAFVADREGGFSLLASRPSALYFGLCHVRESFLERTERTFRWLRPLSFDFEKGTFDIFLTQYARLMRDFDREAYLRECARLGFTHIEVNALAFGEPCEARTRVRGEFYPDFYTYCPGLDQFVSSRLVRGLYPRDYLRANLARLRDNARLALKYGLTPGLLCFEPRTVPEALFERYPTLRGARVDHPFRSFRPRWTLALAHPAVRRHYEELLTNLLREVPALEFLSIWSNDSGSGFEHTKSLYAGRNGGAYLIREWKTDDDIAWAAADNIGAFFRLLRDTGSRVNPAFRVTTRLESFYGERTHLWPQLRDGVDVEVNSLLASGWENNYRHPRYAGISVLGSALHNTLKADESPPRRELERRGSRALFYHFFGPFGNHEPILGVPFPWLVREKLEACRRTGVRHLAHHGGIQPPGQAPYAVNQEVFRAFQTDPEEPANEAIGRIARSWVGVGHAPALLRAWRFVDRAVRSFPPLSIYSGYGVVWQRLFVRPLVPDIEAIPETERAYYEDFMCASVHNPNRVDLGRDVLFELIPKSYAARATRLIDRNVWPPLERARAILAGQAERCRREGKLAAAAVFEDQVVRVRALRCLDTTLRNTAAWVTLVHAYLDARDERARNVSRQGLAALARCEVENSRELLDLWKTSPETWMIVSGEGETPFIYGPNFAALLERKIRLTRRYGGLEPRLDNGFMYRLKNDPYAARASGGRKGRKS